MSTAEQSLPVAAVTEVLGDLAASDWLRESLEWALTRDPVDAMNDALMLASVLEAQLRAVLALPD